MTDFAKLAEAAQSMTGTPVMVATTEGRCDHCAPGSTHYESQLACDITVQPSKRHPWTTRRAWCSIGCAETFLISYLARYAALTGQRIPASVASLVARQEPGLRSTRRPDLQGAYRSGHRSADHEHANPGRPIIRA